MGENTKQKNKRRQFLCKQLNLIKLLTNKLLKLSSNEANNTESLTAGEMGKLWATYMGNRISKCILTNYFNTLRNKKLKFF